MDHAAWLTSGMNGVEEDLKSTYKFFMRPDPAQRKLVGPIQTELDELTNRKMRFREARIGMVRNAKDDDLKPTKVYLDPLPHVRIKDAKQLQGWYQAKSTPENAAHRPRPCYTDAMLTEPYGGFCSVGCSFSCRKGTLVRTASGSRPIETVLEGESVLGRYSWGIGETLVTGLSRHWKEEGYVKIEFEDGKIIEVTADHPLYSSARGWIPAVQSEQGEPIETLRHLPDDESGPYSPGHSTVKSVTTIKGGLWVYDIETTSQNFYAHDVLVHNCYINSGLRGYRGTGLATVPVHYGEQVGEMLDKLKTSAAGYFSSFIDPFLPLEDYYHNTQKGALAFVERGLPIFFLSRIKYPNWAVELLQQNKYSYAQKSINTPDPKIWARLSPGALPLNDHLKDIKRLKKAGIYVSIQCNPILPGIVNHKDVVRLFERLADVGADHVIVKFVEAGYSWAETMVNRTVQRFGPEMGGRFRELFTQNIGGQRTIAEEYRMEGHEIYAKAAKRVGLTYATCYEYAYARDDDGEIINKVGVSIGAKYLSADQCHGHRVPLFTRTSLEEPFKEVKECPPSGCLTCGDTQIDNIGPCGSELFSAAKALKMTDFRHSVYEANDAGPVHVRIRQEDLVQIRRR